MPVTRSSTATAAAATFQTSFHTNFLHAQKENVVQGIAKRQVNRVVASPTQLIALEALHKTECERSLTKDDVLKVASKTGLAEKWIRKWLTRKRHPRSQAKGQDVLADSNEYRENEAQDNYESSQDSGIVKPHSGSILAPIATGDTSTQSSNISILDLLTDVSSTSVSAMRPELSRAYSAPALRTMSHDVQTDPPALHGRETYFSVFARSPSLGYVPSVFPQMCAVDLANSPSLTPSTGSEYSVDLGSLPLPASQSHFPVLPSFSLRPEDMQDLPGTSSSQSMDAILKLFQDVYDTQPSHQQNEALLVHAHQDLSQSVYLPGPAQHRDSAMLSFAPSLQSHSTSVLLNYRARPPLSHAVSSSQPLPVPVSYKTRLSDLAGGLSLKRIRASCVEDLLAASQLPLSVDEDLSDSISPAQSSNGGELTKKDVQDADENINGVATTLQSS